MIARYRLDADHSRFTVQAFAGGALSFLGHSPTFVVRDFTGELDFDPEAPASGWIRVIVRSDSLDLLDNVRPADREEIEGRMRREVLETTTYPEIRFEADAVHARPAAANQYQLRLAGGLSLHGVTGLQEADALLTLFSDGMRLAGESSLRPSEYRMRPVTALGGTIRLTDRLRVVFDIVGWKEES
jgi:polyisoprenoid-binding protein YceI